MRRYWALLGRGPEPQRTAPSRMAKTAWRWSGAPWPYVARGGAEVRPWPPRALCSQRASSPEGPRLSDDVVWPDGRKGVGASSLASRRRDTGRKRGAGRAGRNCPPGAWASRSLWLGWTRGRSRGLVDLWAPRLVHGRGPGPAGCRGTLAAPTKRARERPGAGRRRHDARSPRRRESQRGRPVRTAGRIVECRLVLRGRCREGLAAGSTGVGRSSSGGLVLRRAVSGCRPGGTSCESSGRLGAGPNARSSEGPLRPPGWLLLRGHQPEAARPERSLEVKRALRDFRAVAPSKPPAPEMARPRCRLGATKASRDCSGGCSLEATSAGKGRS